ncbi:MAG TPA: hypothetical protein VLG76_00210 [Rhabdochlamydiaceae bacterium]|nr:hypothetical protein [Rhabdochlamydiaceae bacterium]
MHSLNNYSNNLPSALWNYITDFCLLQDKHQLTLVSKQMRQVARNSEAFSSLKAPITSLSNGDPVASFCYDAKTGMVVTGDWRHFGFPPKVKLWAHGRQIGEFQQAHPLFEHSITRVSIDRSRKELTAISKRSAKIFNLITRREKKALSMPERFRFISLSNNPKNLCEIDVRELTNFFPGDQEEPLKWTFKDSRIHRIFTCECIDDVIKFWDSGSNKRIRKITQIDLKDDTIYDHSRSEMICARKEKELLILDGKEGRVKAKFKVKDRDTNLTAFTLCSKTRKLVAAYRKHEQMGFVQRVKVVVWDIKTVQIVGSFSPQEPNYPINSIFYNEKDRVVLTGGYGCQLLDIDSGQILRKLTERSLNPVIRWDQDRNTIIIREDHDLDADAETLKILKYGNLRPQDDE